MPQPSLPPLPANPRCLISAGPTREYLDPVRFLSNPSTGKMGYAIAEAAVASGWTVDLVSGPSSLPEPPGVVFYPVETGEEMFHQLDALFDAADILIMTAAVTDFRPLQRNPHKVKKNEASLQVEFEPVIDILRTLAARKRADQLIVGFAAETENLEAHAREKLLSKNLDWIVGNLVNDPGAGFASDTNQVLLLNRLGTSHHLGPDSKTQIAQSLLQALQSSDE